MIGVDAFAMPAVRTETKFHPVGLYRYCHQMKVRKDSLLISIGRGGVVADAFRPVVENLGRSPCPEGIRYVFVEPELVPDNPPDWFLTADFTCEMFARLRAAVVRPGLGTICDVLSSGAPLFVAFEEGNLEMRHNAEKLREMCYGWSFDTPAAAFDAAIRYVRELRPRPIPSLDLNGLEQTVSLLREFHRARLLDGGETH